MIDIQNISVAYGKGKVLDGFSVHFAQADFCAVMGPNGAGKSTLLRSIANLQNVDSGIIRIGGMKLSDYKALDLAKTISYVPQREELVFDFSVLDTVMMGRNPYQKRWEFFSKEDEKTVLNILKKTNLIALKGRFLTQLSGGELRRVMIARAMAQQTPIMLLDEPLANLDVVHQFEIMDILSVLNAERNVTIVMILHDFPMALQYAKHVLLLKNGQIQHFGETKSVLTSENVKSCFELDSHYSYTSDGVVKIVKS